MKLNIAGWVAIVVGGILALQGGGMGIFVVLGVLLVDMPTLALPIRAMRATDIRAFAPLNTQPTQRIEDLLFGFASRTHLIGVFDTQDKLTTGVAGVEPIEQGGACASHVKVTCG